jgi:hypothetical protein
MSNPDLDDALRALLTLYGGPGHNRERAEALERLLALADQAYPRLLELANGPSPPDVVLAVLPRFARKESIPVLERALREGSSASMLTAARALAEHAGDEAFEALLGALESPADQVVVSAAEGLVERGDPRARSALEARLAHPNAEVRERIEDALARLDQVKA